MNQYPFNTTDLNDEEVKRFHRCYKALNKKYTFQLDDFFLFAFERYLLFTDYEKFFIREAFLLFPPEHRAVITFSQVHYKFLLNTRRGHRLADALEYQPWAIAVLPKDFGHVMIRKETFQDKIQELFHPIEIDFKEDTDFSKRFYCVARYHEKALAAINHTFRKAVLELKTEEPLIEIIGHHLIIGNKKPVDEATVVDFAEFIEKISVPLESTSKSY